MKTKYILVGVVLGAILLVAVLYWTFGRVRHPSQDASAQPCSRPAAGVQTFTDDNFDREVVESDCPVLVFFTAVPAKPAYYCILQRRRWADLWAFQQSSHRLNASCASCRYLLLLRFS